MESEIKGNEDSRIKLEFVALENDYYDIVQSIYQIETDSLKHRKQLRKMRKQLQSSVTTITHFEEIELSIDTLEKETTKLAEQVDITTDNLIDIQGKINSQRLHDLEEQGERLDRLDNRKIDVISNEFDNDDDDTQQSSSNNN